MSKRTILEMLEMRQKQGNEAEARKRGSKGTRQNKATRAETKSADERRHRERQKEGTADIVRLSSST